jgi:hypothetical protein
VQPPYPTSPTSAPVPGTVQPRLVPQGPPWPRHDKSPGEPDDDYLVPPDPAIGRVVSAQTNRKQHGWYKIDSGTRGSMIGFGILGFLLGGIVCLALGGAIGDEIRPHYYYDPYGYGGYGAPPEDHTFDDVRREIADVLPWITGIGGGLFFTTMGVVLPWLLRRRRSSYVGQQGLQEYVKYHLVGPKQTVVRFADCMQLQVARTRHFYNGVYTGTRFSYVWWDRQAKRAFTIEGQYNDQIARTPGELVSFAWAAESAWTQHKIAEIDRQIATSGMARFNVGADYVGIGKGFLEIGWRGQVVRLPRPEIQTLQFETGWLVIKRTGAKEGWFSSDGVFRFPVSGMADFQVFMIVLEEQTGFRFR